jgi:UDP-N-acetylmuramoylalanine--D-glutamate ligase
LFAKIVKAYLIGEAAEAFAATIGDAIPYEFCGTLDVATRRAAEDAAQSDVAAPVVLLSPACASFDQYPDFEKRGDHFRQIVGALLAEAPAGG